MLRETDQDKRNCAEDTSYCGDDDLYREVLEAIEKNLKSGMRLAAFLAGFCVTALSAILLILLK